MDRYNMIIDTQDLDSSSPIGAVAIWDKELKALIFLGSIKKPRPEFMEEIKAIASKHNIGMNCIIELP